MRIEKIVATMRERRQFVYFVLYTEKGCSQDTAFIIIPYPDYTLIHQSDLFDLCTANLSIGIIGKPVLAAVGKGKGIEGIDGPVGNGE